MVSSSTTVALDIAHLISEDDTPVDNLPSAKHQRLFTEPLYSSWTNPHAERPFLAAANVGIFAVARRTAVSGSNTSVCGCSITSSMIR